MTPTATRQATRTAADLLEQLRAYVPRVEGYELAFDADPPADLEDAVGLLQSGIRAALTGRRWFGIDAGGRPRGTGTDGCLDPARPIPAAVTLLCAEGDPRWDRVRPSARDACRAYFSAK